MHPSTLPIPARRCGSSGLMLPVLGLGCWQFGGGDYWGAQSQSDVDAVVRSAIDHGCNFFDTAEAYNGGASESSLGAALRGIPRDRVILCTKISPANTAPETLALHCDASLRRLQTDYIDFYLVHWPITAPAIKHFTREPIPTPSMEAAFATLERLRQAGKIRSIGVSNFGRPKLQEALATGAKIVVNELPYSLLTRAIEFDILPFCREQNIGVLGYMALLQGVLSDRYATLDDLPAIRRRTRHFDSRKVPLCRHGLPGCEAETTRALHAIRAVAKREGMTTSELALKWTFANPAITSSLCGHRNVAALQANLRAVQQPLAAELVAELNQLTQPLLDALGPSFDYYEHPDNDRTK